MLSKTKGLFRVLAVLLLVVGCGAPRVQALDAIPQITLSEASKAAISATDLQYLEELRMAIAKWRYENMPPSNAKIVEQAFRLAHSLAKKVRYPLECQATAKLMLNNFVKFRFNWVFGSSASVNSQYRIILRSFMGIYKAMTGNEPKL